MFVFCSKFHPNKLRRHTVSFDNLDDIESLSEDEADKAAEDDDIIGTHVLT